MVTTAQRIKEALDIRNMKQTDLVEKTGIGKSSISTYISGEYSPKQKNLYKIAKALDVNEAWLMGLDAPMERDDYENQNLITFDATFDEAVKLLSNAHYIVSLSDDNDSDIIIKDEKREILACMHDYELVGKYMEVCRNKSFTPEDLIQITKTKNDFTLNEYNHIKRYRSLDNFGRERIDYELARELERVSQIREIESSSHDKDERIIDLEERLVPRRIFSYHG